MQKTYVSIPYSLHSGDHVVTITIDDRIYTELLVSSSFTGERAYIPVPAERNQIKVTGEENIIKHITLEDKAEAKGTSPFSYHFAPGKGWINDPNGLIFHDGVYHLYYQNNPVSKEWKNMSWGHAISTDLLRWQEEDTFLLPKNRDKTIFSGSAFLEDNKIAFYYTLADIVDDALFTQRRAESKDGYTIDKDEEVVGPLGKGTRDPKIFIHNDSKYMVLYLEKNDFALFKEENGKWVKTSVFSAEEAWECPDIICVKDKLFFISADGFYWNCEIENDEVRIVGNRGNLYTTKLPYAAQSYSNVNDRVIIVPWLRVLTPSLLSTGAMGLPREVDMVGNRLSLIPIREFLDELEKIETTKEKTAFPEQAFILEASCSFKGQVNGNNISYNKEIGELIINDSKASFTPESELCIMVDSHIAEISDKRFTENAYFELDLDASKEYTGSEITPLSDGFITRYMIKEQQYGNH